MKIKPQLLVNSVLFKEGELYKKSLEETTYKKLMSLGNFRAVKIEYNEDSVSKGFLVVKILLVTLKHL